MTIKAQLEAIRSALATWAASHKGTAQVAGDAADVALLLGAGPGRLRVLVVFVEERKRGEHEEAGRVDRAFSVIISRGRGFNLMQSDSLVRGVAGAEPLYDLVEGARQIIRGIEFSEDEPYCDYTRASLLSADFSGQLVDAYAIEFTVGTQLDAPE